MKNSDRLKKLETDLEDLQRWVSLDLVPKNDLAEHRKEILALQDRIEEEKSRLQVLKENGDQGEYSIPKRNQQNRPVFREPQTLPGVEHETDVGMTETTTVTEAETEAEWVTSVDEDLTDQVTSSETDGTFFNENERWRRLGSMRKELNLDDDPW